jgi:hypothetical protein
VLGLLFTGFYPTITWMPFVIAGMAPARLDLSQVAVRWRLAALGAALTVAAYGMSLGGDRVRRDLVPRPRNASDKPLARLPPGFRRR